MGPPEKKPILPRYECLECVGPNETIDINATERGTDGPVIAEFNWFQNYENVMDTFHVSVLHDSFSGTQFVPELGAIPRVEWSYTPHGMKAESWRDLDDGRTLRAHQGEVVFPTVRAVGSTTLAYEGPTRSVGWMLPIDDTTFRIYNATRIVKDGPSGRRSQRPNGKTWSVLSADERRDAPGDYEAQRGQGIITLHSEDHLTSTDRGVSMMRKLWREQVEIVASGGDPMGVTYAEDVGPIRLETGNFFE